MESEEFEGVRLEDVHTLSLGLLEKTLAILQAQQNFSIEIKNVNSVPLKAKEVPVELADMQKNKLADYIGRLSDLITYYRQKTVTAYNSKIDSSLFKAQRMVQAKWSKLSDDDDKSKTTVTESTSIYVFDPLKLNQFIEGLERLDYGIVFKQLPIDQNIKAYQKVLDYESIFYDFKEIIDIIADSYIVVIRELLFIYLSSFILNSIQKIPSTLSDDGVIYFRKLQKQWENISGVIVQCNMAFLNILGKFINYKDAVIEKTSAIIDKYRNLYNSFEGVMVDDKFSDAFTKLPNVNKKMRLSDLKEQFKTYKGLIGDLNEYAKTMTALKHTVFVYLVFPINMGGFWNACNDIRMDNTIATLDGAFKDITRTYNTTTTRVLPKQSKPTNNKPNNIQSFQVLPGKSGSYGISSSQPNSVGFAPLPNKLSVPGGAIDASSYEPVNVAFDNHITSNKNAVFIGYGMSYENKLSNVINDLVHQYKGADKLNSIKLTDCFELRASDVKLSQPILSLALEKVNHNIRYEEDLSGYQSVVESINITRGQGNSLYNELNKPKGLIATYNTRNINRPITLTPYTSHVVYVFSLSWNDASTTYCTFIDLGSCETYKSIIKKQRFDTLEGIMTTLQSPTTNGTDINNIMDNLNYRTYFAKTLIQTFVMNESIMHLGYFLRMISKLDTPLKLIDPSMDTLFNLKSKQYDPTKMFLIDPLNEDKFGMIRELNKIKGLSNKNGKDTEWVMLGYFEQSKDKAVCETRSSQVAYLQHIKPNKPNKA